MNEIIPTNEESREAMGAAYDMHHNEKWINDLTEEEAKDILRQIWCITSNYYLAPEIRYFNIKTQLDGPADRLSQAYSDQNWPKHLGR